MMTRSGLKMTPVFLLIVALLTAVPAGKGYAAQSRGDGEVMVSGTYTHATGSKVGTAAVDLSYGYFTAPALQLGVRQTLSYNFIDDAKDTWLATTAPFANYHFRGLSINDNVQPFVGAFAGAAYNDKRGSGMIGPQAGIKMFVRDKTFVSTLYRYEWYWNAMRFGDMTDTTRGNNVVTIGVGFLL